MAEFELDDENSPSLTRDDIIAFFDAKNIPLKCEYCNNESWLLLEEKSDEIATLAFVNRRIRLLEDRSVGLIMSNCSNCGNARIFLRTVLKKWIDEQRVSSNSQAAESAD